VKIMKISNSSQMTGVVRNKSGASANPAAKATTQGTDRVALSGGADEVNTLNTMMQQIPDATVGKIPELRQLIGDGTYHAPSRDVAEKMLDRWKDFTTQPS
jgi:flagellar biosynthesis anti-sigma factor FlgM